MPLQKILFKPGVNRENTRYTTEGGWYDCDKVRFRQGTPEVIGGWEKVSSNVYLGVCRSLWNWITLSGANLVSVGTNLKYYILEDGVYKDITPIRTTTLLGANPFTADGTTTVLVTATSHGAINGDFVTFSGSTTSVFNAQYQITYKDSNSYYITLASPLAAGSYGGSAVYAAYQINTGPETQTPLTGWGSYLYGFGGWGTGVSNLTVSLRLWSVSNWGEDLVFGPRGGGVYYWDATNTTNTRGYLLRTPSSTYGAVSIPVASPAVVTATNLLLTEGAAIQFNFTSGGGLPTGISANTTYYVYNVDGLSFQLLDSAGAIVNATGSAASNAYVSLLDDVPSVQNYLAISDTSRFILAFGVNDYGSAIQDPMLIRWSNQEDPYNWTPNATNQAGSVRLSHGSEIVTAIQTRQEIVVFTDTAVYSLQYLGPPYVWGSQLLGDNISIVGQNSVALASGIVYWMGVDKFYAYDGRVQTLNCDLRRYIFNDLNQTQNEQIFAGTSEGFNEVWWFYCSANSTVVNKYVVYNYQERIWYYGTLGRTAWLDSGLRSYPLAATYSYNLVDHEKGLNNAENPNGAEVAINAYISSSEFDIGDGHNFGFIWRVLPDITFSNSEDTPTNPPLPAAVTMTLYGLYNSGSGALSSASASVLKGSSYVVTEEFTGYIFTRVRGRQMIFKVESNQLNTTWQLGAPRIDIRPDGRR